MKSLTIQETLDGVSYKALTDNYFPNLEHVEHFRDDVNNLTVHQNVKFVILRSCLTEYKEPVSNNDFAFPNALNLVLDGIIYEITAESRIMYLDWLEHLAIRNCAIHENLARNKFPRLRSLALKGVFVCANIQISRMEKPHRLKLVDVENHPQKAKWKGVRMFSLSNVRRNQHCNP